MSQNQALIEQGECHFLLAEMTEKLELSEKVSDGRPWVGKRALVSQHWLCP